jgi:hypothetical protein
MRVAELHCTTSCWSSTPGWAPLSQNVPQPLERSEQIILYNNTFPVVQYLYDLDERE